jgi:hypothetical protein
MIELTTATAPTYNTLPDLPAHLDFDPMREAQTRNGIVIPNKYWVVNPITDKVIGDGKSVHNPHNYRAMWDNLRQGLLLGGLDTSNVEVDFNSMSDGSAMSAKIVLKNYNFEKKLGEAAKMVMLVRDSHDQSVRRQVSAMIYRLACLNGMMSVKERIGISQKHTTYADPETVGKVASTFPEKLERDAEQMSQMRQVRITRDYAIDFFRRNVATYITKTGAKVNNKYLEKVVGVYDWYNELGDNTYRLYNTLTHISTHVEAQRDGTEVERKRIRVEQDIEAVIHGEEFQRLLEVA